MIVNNTYQSKASTLFNQKCFCSSILWYCEVNVYEFNSVKCQENKHTKVFF